MRAGLLKSVFLAVAVAAGGLWMLAAPAQASHTICDNEALPGDVYVTQTIGGVGTVLVGTDLGLNHPPFTNGLCVYVEVLGFEFNVAHVVRGEDANPSALGYQARAYYCINGVCATYLQSTGAEVGTVSTTYANLLCVGSICVGTPKVKVPVTVYANDIVVPLPICVTVPPQTCP